MNYLETSIVIIQIKRLLHYYQRMEDRLRSIYHESTSYKIQDSFKKILKASLKNSTLGKLTEIREDSGTIDILETSVIYNFLYKKFLIYKEYIFNSLSSSISFNLFNNIRYDATAEPLKTFGIITTIALTINIILIFLTGYDWTILGMMLRIVLLILGIIALFSNSKCTLDRLTEESRVLQFLNRGE